MLLAQHGWGKGDLVIKGVEAGLLDGLILSPRDEAPEKISDHVADLRKRFGSKLQVLFDPQLYALTIPNHRIGTLPDYYPGLNPGLSRADLSSPKRVRKAVTEILKLQQGLGVSRLIAPSVLLSSFRDPWSQIALSLAEQSIEAASALTKAPPLYISLVMDENALLAHDALDEFLDIITAWDEVTGFYVVMRPNDAGFPAIIQDGAIAGLVYMTHVLAKVNDFEVVAGYSDLVGTLLHAAGATHTASGWFNSLRQFSLARFQPAGGGRQPRPRYTSGPLMSTILVIPELETIQRVSRVRAVLSGTAYDQAFATTRAGAVTWAKPTPHLHHWAVLRQLAEHVRTPRTSRARLAAAEQLVTQAGVIFDDVRHHGVGFEPSTGGRHLNSWLRGLQIVRPLLGA